MSLYNSLFGINKQSNLLLQILDIDQSGKWSSGRFRDTYLNEDGKKIFLLTRNGGGNRNHHDDEKKAGIDCDCCGCIINYQLPRHPNYIKDFDDSYDCTYAIIEFSVPKEWEDRLKDISTGKPPETLKEKFENQIELMQKGDKSAIEKAHKIMSPIIEQLQKLKKND